MPDGFLTRSGLVLRGSIRDVGPIVAERSTASDIDKRIIARTGIGMAINDLKVCEFRRRVSRLSISDHAIGL